MVPTCTRPADDFCSRRANFKARDDIRGLYTPFCRNMNVACESQPQYSSSTLFETCFSEHVDAKVNWCCLTDGRPNFAAGWLLVRRSDFLLFQKMYDIGEDGQLIGHYLSLNKNIFYVDIPIGYYNQDHMNPACSNEWF